MKIYIVLIIISSIFITSSCANMNTYMNDIKKSYFPNLLEKNEVQKEKAVIEKKVRYESIPELEVEKILEVIDNDDSEYLKNTLSKYEKLESEDYLYEQVFHRYGVVPISTGHIYIRHKA